MLDSCNHAALTLWFPHEGLKNVCFILSKCNKNKSPHLSSWSSFPIVDAALFWSSMTWNVCIIQSQTLHNAIVQTTLGDCNSVKIHIFMGLLWNEVPAMKYGKYILYPNIYCLSYRVLISFQCLIVIIALLWWLCLIGLTALFALLHFLVHNYLQACFHLNMFLVWWCFAQPPAETNSHRRFTSILKSDRNQPSFTSSTALHLSELTIRQIATYTYFTNFYYCKHTLDCIYILIFSPPKISRITVRGKNTSRVGTAQFLKWMYSYKKQSKDPLRELK